MVPSACVDILIPVQNEWHVLRPCLDSIEAFTDSRNVSITVLDDASDSFVQARLQQWVKSGGIPKRILRNEVPLGFVKNSNRGFGESSSELVLLLNSDTLVTPGWLSGMVELILADPGIACIMPMSNQCSLHSLEIPMGWNIFQYAADLRRTMPARPFDAVTVGGFCLLIRRRALEDVGYYDEAFGMGYGEESDWCMRARSRGWKVTGARNTFVYHRGKVTFKDHKQKTFRETNYKLFMQRWSQPYSHAIAEYHRADSLASLRSNYVRMQGTSPPPVLSAFADRVKTGGAIYAATAALRYLRDQGGARRLPSLVRSLGLIRKRDHVHPVPKGFQSKLRPRITYVLEKFSLSGGVVSVVQLVNRLTLLGWDAKIATHHEHNQEHHDEFMLYHHPYFYSTTEEMIENFPQSDIIVATLWSSAAKVHRIIQERQPHAVPWYFVQDDETKFIDDGDRVARARVMESYQLIPNKIVKSDWLRDILASRGHDSRKIPLGLDLDLFYSTAPPESRPPRILAMARPDIPRRGFAALVRTLRVVKQARPAVEIMLFGCDDLSPHDLGFEYTNVGIVESHRLRNIYNQCAIFLDLSEFQGLGRMGLEAMACGCATVLTKFGGIAEYAMPGLNCLSVDPSDTRKAVEATLRLIDDHALRCSIAQAGFGTARKFSCDLEARATSGQFAQSLGIEANVVAGRIKARQPSRSPASGTAVAQAQLQP